MQNRLRIVWRTALLIPTILGLSFAQAIFAQKSREQIDGVKNFGRVTDLYFRGGQVTPDGVDALAGMGVKTIVDLRDEESPGESEACRRNGIRYFKFPMSGHVTPDEREVNRILSIIQQVKEPVYVHCSAGKHRAGTIAALYRIRVQGWSKEQAWAEQKSYGFGPPEGHPKLYAYVYDRQSEPADSDIARSIDRSAAVNDEDRSSKKAKKKDDHDDHDSSKSKKKKKDDKSLKKADDDDDDDDKDDGAKSEDRGEKVKHNSRLDRAKIAEEPPAKAEKLEPANSGRAGLSAAAGYLTMAEAIKRAKDEGAEGEVLKVDLEWDPARSVVTWDVTFSSGAEYELDAGSGRLLGTKSKAPAKLATLSPLPLGDSAKRLLTFQQIIRKTEANRNQTVMEMELKQIKGRPETIYEVVLANGETILYDAATGNEIVV